MSREIKSKFPVLIEEYERGWGSRLDEVVNFDNEQEALAYIAKYNSYNTEETVPDWYMVAKKGWE